LLASAFLHEPLPPTFGFWRGLVRRYFTALCHNPNLENAADLSVARPCENDWIALAETAPPMKGLEYLNSAVFARLWDELEAHTRHKRTGEDNADARLKRQIMGREVVVAITKGKPDLDPWEKIFYGEFDGRRRNGCW